jgi:hypothetical protein
MEAFKPGPGPSDVYSVIGLQDDMGEAITNIARRPIRRWSTALAGSTEAAAGRHAGR